MTDLDPNERNIAKENSNKTITIMDGEAYLKHNQTLGPSPRW